MEELCSLPGCSEPASYSCNRCLSVGYCSPGHQEADWPAHKPVCLDIKRELRKLYAETVTLPEIEQKQRLHDFYNTKIKLYIPLIRQYINSPDLIKIKITPREVSEILDIIIPNNIRLLLEIHRILIEDLKTENNDDNKSFLISLATLCVYYIICKSLITLWNFIRKIGSTNELTKDIIIKNAVSETNELFSDSIIYYGIATNPITDATTIDKKIHVLRIVVLITAHNQIVPHEMLSEKINARIRELEDERVKIENLATGLARAFGPKIEAGKPNCKNGSGGSCSVMGGGAIFKSRRRTRHQRQRRKSYKNRK